MPNSPDPGRSYASGGSLPKRQAPTAAYIEIVERDRTTTDTLGGSVITPNEVRINGVPLAVPSGQSIRVHEMTFGEDRDVAQVTMTLYVRRLTIAAEGDLDAGGAS